MDELSDCPRGSVHLRFVLAVLALVFSASRMEAAPMPDRDGHFEFFGMLGTGVRVLPGMNGASRRPAFQVGAGYRLSQHLGIELVGGYHDLGRQNVIDFDQSLPQRLYLTSMTSELTVTSGSLSAARPYVSAGAGVYTILDQFRAPYSGHQLRSLPGFNVGVGVKGRTGAWAPRVDLRLHLRPMDAINSEISAIPAGSWLRVFEVSAGLQLP